MDEEKHSEYIQIPEGVPQVDPEFLWINGWYDGPTDGAVRVDGELMIARMAAECWHPEGTCDWYRKYAVMKIPFEDQAEEVERHNDFVHYVSGDTGEGWSWRPFGYRPSAEWHKYYEKHPTDPVLPEGEIVGWFSLG